MLRGARMLVAARSMRTLDNMRRDVCAAQQWPLSLSVSCASGRRFCRSVDASLGGLLMARRWHGARAPQRRSAPGLQGRRERRSLGVR